jgi:hypothetical protein
MQNVMDISRTKNMRGGVVISQGFYFKLPFFALKFGIIALKSIFFYVAYVAVNNVFFSFGATTPIWALAYLHETLRFASIL